MTGSLLGRYFARTFARALLLVFGGIVILVFLLDFMELLRRAGEVKSASAGTMALLAALRVPAITEQVLPFVILFGAMIAFMVHTRRLEVVVARAAGLSVWQFLVPALLVALGTGAVATAAYNPLAAACKLRADRMEAGIFGSALAQPENGVWLRQRSVDGAAILRGDRLEDDRVTLANVSAFMFGPDGTFVERVNARSATLQPGVWRFLDARIVSPDLDVEPRHDDTYLLATNLKPTQLTEATLAPRDVSFWELPAVERRTLEAGLDATEFRLRFQVLLAQPVALAAEVLVAAVFSLRLFRFGGVAVMAAGGIAAGFLLYVVTKMSSDLGGAGILNAGVAAWSPALVAGMLATFVLLHQEDG